MCYSYARCAHCVCWFQPMFRVNSMLIDQKAHTCRKLKLTFLKTLGSIDLDELKRRTLPPTLSPINNAGFSPVGAMADCQNMHADLHFIRHRCMLQHKHGKFHLGSCDCLTGII